MNSPKSHLFRSILVAAAALIAMARPGTAENPSAVPRTFAQFTGKNGTCVDWEADSSRRIVAHRAGNDADVIEFGTPGEGWLVSDFIIQDEDGNLILDLRDTTWVQVPVLHVTESGAEFIDHVYWLVDAGAAPDTGLTAGTGPDGEVATFVSFGISWIPPVAGFNGGKYRVSSSGEARFCVSIGEFNK